MFRIAENGHWQAALCRDSRARPAANAAYGRLRRGPLGPDAQAAAMNGEIAARVLAGQVSSRSEHEQFVRIILRFFQKGV